MAIDTAEKRRSVAGIGFFLVGPGVTPNATKDQEWRQQAGWSYSGILAGAAAAVAEFWCALTGMSGLTGGGDIEELG